MTLAPRLLLLLASVPAASSVALSCSETRCEDTLTCEAEPERSAGASGYAASGA
jgi:hypothetical protein